MTSERAVSVVGRLRAQQAAGRKDRAEQDCPADWLQLTVKIPKHGSFSTPLSRLAYSEVNLITNQARRLFNANANHHRIRRLSI